MRRKTNLGPFAWTTAGFSLLEVIVVMGIIGMIAVPLANFSIKTASSYEFLQAQSDTSTELNILAGRVTRVVRGATSVETAQTNSLVLYGYFSPQDTVIKKIRYFIAGTNLNIGVTPPSGAGPNYIYDPATEVITTTRVDLSMGTNPLFTYYDDAGNNLGTTFNVSQVRVVGLYLAANPNAKQVPVPISLSTKVTLRNLKVNL